jgi:autotransporter-associated beta strand protein
MKSVQSLSVATLLALALVATSGPLQAQTWQNGGDSLWGNPANWTTDPFIPDSFSAVFFDAAGSTTVDLGGASRDLFNLTYNFGAQGYTFSGNAGDMLNFSPFGSIYANSGMAGPQAINSAIGLNGDAFMITNDDTTNQLTLGGDISLVSGTADVLTVTGAGDTTINGAIGVGVITGLSKTGAGTLTLGGANAYSGTTTILGGTITSTSNIALGDGDLVFGDGSSSATGTLHVMEDLTIGSLSVRNYDATIASGISIDAGNTLTVDGAFTAGISGLGGDSSKLNVLGPGTM